MLKVEVRMIKRVLLNYVTKKTIKFIIIQFSNHKAFLKTSANSPSVKSTGFPFILLAFRDLSITAGRSSSVNPNSDNGGTSKTSQRFRTLNIDRRFRILICLFKIEGLVFEIFTSDLILKIMALF